MTVPRVSIVMPVLDEQRRVAAAMSRLVRDFPDCELVVVDGQSVDGTLATARRAAASLGHRTVRVVSCAPGRARQMNHGARLATGELLWFVHVDTAIDPAALAQLEDAARDPQVVGGGLTLRFDRTSLGLRYLAWTSNIRARRLSWVFGDQAIFVRRRVFDAVGGFPDLAIMEDLELSRRLARHGRLRILAASSTASTRRFEVHGVWRMLVFMQWLKVLHFRGVDSRLIAERYAAGPGWGPPRPFRRSAQPPTTEECVRVRSN